MSIPVLDDQIALRDVLLRNGYPKAFIEEHFQWSIRPGRDRPDEPNKKAFLKVQFKGDSASELFRRKLERTMARNCKDVRLVLIFTTNKLLTIQSKENLPRLAKSNVIYEFTCSTCNLQYIGLTHRRLEERIKEHIPKKLVLATEKTMRSSITAHMIEEEHICNRDSCFRIVHKAKNPRLLKFIEAFVIRKSKPKLNVQVEMGYKLQLPWI